MPSASFERDAARRDDRRGATGGMALDIDRHRIHRDVGGGHFDMHTERSRAPTQALRPNAKLVDRLAQLRLYLGALRIGAGGAERPRGGNLGKMHAEVD